MRARLREIRLHRGWTQLEMAAITGMSPSMLSRVERGERELAPEAMVEVARRLGVPVDSAFELSKLGQK